MADRSPRTSAAASTLFGHRIVITRAVEQSSDLVTKLERRGAIPISLPLVAFSTPENFAPLDTALHRWQEFDWVLFTSANTVQSVAQRAATTNLGILRPSSRPQIAPSLIGWCVPSAIITSNAPVTPPSCANSVWNSKPTGAVRVPSGRVVDVTGVVVVVTPPAIVGGAGGQQQG